MLRRETSNWINWWISRERVRAHEIYPFPPDLLSRLPLIPDWGRLRHAQKTGVSPRREKCASFTSAPHTKTKLPLFSTSTFIYTYFKSSDWRIAAAQAWRCCWLTRDWWCSRKSRTGFSTLLTKGEALLGACKMINPVTHLPVKHLTHVRCYVIKTLKLPRHSKTHLKTQLLTIWKSFPAVLGPFYLVISK